MSLNRLNPKSDVSRGAGRHQLQETLSLIANKLRRVGVELEKVRESDKIVRPVPIEEFPVAVGQIYTGEEGGNIGDITWRAVNEAPAGTFLCNGAAVSRITYADLFAKIGTLYGAGNGTTTFNLPDLRGRTPIGVGQGTGLTNRLLSAQIGAEVHQLTTTELPAHSHHMTHDHPTTLDIYTQDPFEGGTPGNRPRRTTSFTDSNVYDGPPTGGVTNPPHAPGGVPSTANTGNGTPHNNMQPSIVLAPFIRFRLGPTDTIQTLPIAWGRVNAQWRLDTLKSFPKSAVENLHQVSVTDGRPEGVVRVSALGGIEAGNSNANKIEALIPIPYNFRRWRTQGIKVRTRLEMTGVAGGTQGVITLRVSDPNVAGGFLSQTVSRTIGASGGSISDGSFKDLQLTAEKLGRDWKPGYMLRFELTWSIPRTFTQADLYVGFLGIYM